MQTSWKHWPQTFKQCKRKKDLNEPKSYYFIHQELLGLWKMDVPYPNEPDLSLESLLKQCLLLWYYYADKIAFWLLVHITVQIIRKKGKDYDLAPFLNLVTKQQQQQQQKQH